MDIPSFIAVAGVALIAVVLKHRPELRRPALFGALFSLPVVVAQLLTAGAFERLGGTTWDSIVVMTQMTALVLVAGSVAALLINQTLTRWMSPRAHPNRHALGWLLIGASSSVIVALFGWSFGLAAFIGVAINGVILLTLDRTLIWDAILSASAFSFLYVVADLVFGVRTSGDIDRLLIGQMPIGITIDGLPVERLILLFLIGLVVGPLYAATKRYRGSYKHSPAAEWPKVLFCSTVVIVGAALLFWWSWEFVLPPTVLRTTPATNAIISNATTEIIFTFSRPVNRDELLVSATPEISGWWEFAEPTMSDHGFRQAHFILDEPLIPDTRYTIHLKNIRSIWDIRGNDVRLSFQTDATDVGLSEDQQATLVVVNQPSVAGATKVVLPIALDYQDSPLSCEAAALKMALAGVGVHVTERQIMKEVGYDPTPRRRGVWGNPDQAFVGNIAGRQNSTGYGVHWAPIARAARKWRTARVLTNATPSQLAAELQAGHPSVIWGTVGPAHQDLWRTRSRKVIQAWKGEHARTVIGFTGTVDKPVSFIINDPIVGRQTWSTQRLLLNWNTFHRNAVVVE